MERSGNKEEEGTIVALSKRFSPFFISNGACKYFNSNNENFGKNMQRILFVLDIPCEGSIEYLTDVRYFDVRENIPLNFVEYRYFDSTWVWIVFAKLEEIEQHNLYFPVNRLVYVVTREKSSNFFINIIFKYNVNLTYEQFDVGKWVPTLGSAYFNSFSLPRNRTDFKGHPVRVSYVISNNGSLKHLWDYREIFTDKLTKANYIIISHLLEMLNASKIDVWADTWGYKNEGTKMFNGMYADLILDKADLAGGDLRFLYQFFYKINETNL